MAFGNKLELVVEVDVNKANASIKSINTGLSSMEQAAGKAARGASTGIDGLTVSRVSGNLFVSGAVLSGYRRSGPARFPLAAYRRTN
jgi:hypothetical protein